MQMILIGTNKTSVKKKDILNKSANWLHNKNLSKELKIPTLNK